MTVSDILAKLGEAFAYEDIESQCLEVRGVPVEVATPAMLYKMKRDTARLQDKADAQRIAEHFNLDEEDDS